MRPDLPLDRIGLWDHQREAVDLCDRYFAGHSARAGLVHHPTGTGKTGIIATISTRRARSSPVLVVCPSEALVGQLSREIAKDFWQRISASLDWAPEYVLTLLPSKVDDILADLHDKQGRKVTLGTIQALQQIHAARPSDYQRLVGQFGTVIFDEGHREPAQSWAEAARGLSAPTILMSATPFRNDLKLFDVDLNYIHFLSFSESVEKHIIRDVQIEEEDLSVDSTEFARRCIKVRNDLVSSGRFASTSKMIVRAASEHSVEALFEAFRTQLQTSNDGVLAIHDRFNADGRPGALKLPDVPDDLKSRPEKFLIHQFKLMEGIDEPSCVMLAVFDPFSNERQLVQQIGRITRNSQGIGRACPDAFVLARTGDGVKKMFDRFKTFDQVCIDAGGKPPVRNDTAIVAKILEAMPQADYIAGKFRSRTELDDDKIDEDLRFPMSAIVFSVAADFDLDDFQKYVSRLLYDEDRQEFKVGVLERGQCRFHVSTAIRQSPFLEETLFQSTTLEVTIYSLHNRRLYFFDSSGLWPDEAKKIVDRLGPGSLRIFFARDFNYYFAQR